MSSLIGLARITEVADNVRFIPGTEHIVDMRTTPLDEFPEEFREKVKELAASIEEHGLLSPLVVKDIRGGERFRLVAGFRRFKALQYLGRRHVEVKSIKNKTRDEIVVQLVENIQRDDLSPLDVAETLGQISASRGGLSQMQLAKLVGQSQSWVSQRLALLRAHESVKRAVQEGRLGFSAAAALAVLQLPDQVKALADAEREAHRPEGEGEGQKRKKRKADVSFAGARRQVRKRKNEQKDKQLKIRPVAEREHEQRVAVVSEFMGDYYGDGVVPEGVKDVVEGFWDFLFRKNRLMIKP